MATLPQVPTIAEASRLIETKAMSPVELTDLCLRRIEALDSRVNSFLLVTEEQARAAARRAETEIGAGRRLGPLHGIPLGLKDLYATKGIRTTAHSRLLADNVPDEDSTVAAKLAEAGMVLLGKLATHEFAIGGPSFDLPWPPARNPWDTDHFTGGSSSGSGAAIAAGFVLGATGSDTGGSIRTPSALCGVTGVKPTYGVVSRHGIVPLAVSLDHAGPMAWTVEDCAIMLQAMAGYDAKDPTSARVPIPDYRAALRQDLKGLRVGVIRNFHEEELPVDAEFKGSIDAAVTTMAGLGAEVRDVRLPSLADFAACGTVIVLTEGFAVHARTLGSRFDDYGERFRNRVVLGALMSGPDYVQALRLRRQLIRQTQAAILDVDVIVTAAASGEAPKIEGGDRDGAFKRPSFAMPFNVTGQPVVTVCCGFSSSGFPLGLQVVAKPFEDSTALAVAHAYERASPWRSRRPVMTAKP